jgi:tetratricopeptide (TPR) repeat protein
VILSEIQAPDGKELVTVRTNAADDTKIIEAINDLSLQLRKQIGESLVTVRATEPLENVTTASLDALRLYTEAERLAEQSQQERAADKLRQAIAIDSTFGMAYRKLAVILSNLGTAWQEQLDVITRAYELRDRMSEREGLLTAGWYYSLGPQYDREKVIEAYEAVLAKYPRDRAALNNIQIHYQAEISSSMTAGCSGTHFFVLYSFRGSTKRHIPSLICGRRHFLATIS